MKLHSAVLLAACLTLGSGALHAQDATIIHGRIVVGDGPVIDDGSIVVQGGRIESVQPGAPGRVVGTVIDARGMTVMPGFIDGHKHLNTSPAGEKVQMQDLIDNGFTTVLSALGPADSNLALIEQIDAGQISSRIIASGRFDLHGSPAQARDAVRSMASQGIHFTGEVAVTPVPTATPAELAVLRAALDEGRKDGVEVLVHAVSSPAMVAAAEAGIRHQVSVRESRKVRADHCIQWQGQVLQLDIRRDEPVLVGKSVSVHTVPEGRLYVYHGDRRLQYHRVAGEQRATIKGSQEALPTTPKLKMANPTAQARRRAWLFGHR